MAHLIENVEKTLQAKNINPATIEEVKSAIIEHMTPKSIENAVLFLGLATVSLAFGSIVLAGLDKTVPEALWSALGAGIGGLAGIFMGRQ